MSYTREEATIVVQDHIRWLEENDRQTIASGVYIGKMWKAQHDGKWWLRWYDKEVGDEMAIEMREIVLT